MITENKDDKQKDCPSLGIPHKLLKDKVGKVIVISDTKPLPDTNPNFKNTLIIWDKNDVKSKYAVGFDPFEEDRKTGRMFVHTDVLGASELPPFTGIIDKLKPETTERSYEDVALVFGTGGPTPEPEPRSIKNIYYYLQGNFRHILFYSNFAFLIRKHILEQINSRVLSMKKECYDTGSCVKCGCGTIELQMCNKACKGLCYPEMQSKKKWNILKRHGVINSKSYFWELENGKFKKYG